MCICTHLNTSTHTQAHPNTPTHTKAYPFTLTHTPHIPTNALNLINHMKFYINRPNTKKARERERKKKEGRNKSPLKHFSGLKNDIL